MGQIGLNGVEMGGTKLTGTVGDVNRDMLLQS